MGKLRRMKKRVTGFTVVAWLALVFLLGSSNLATGADALVWRTGQDQVDAEIDGWPLPKVLEAIASATGWEIYFEPDIQYTVTSRFHQLKTPEALRRLLGELNFALLPQTNGPARLFIYRNSLHDATQLIQVTAKAKTGSGASPIPNEIIVRLKPGSKESIDALAKRLGAKIAGRIEGLNAYRLQFDDAVLAQNARAELENDTDVDSVENNFALAAPGQLQPLGFNSPPPSSFKLAPPSSTDKLMVALVDTPVQSTGAPWADYITARIPLAGQADLDPSQLTHGTAMMDTLWEMLGKTLNDPGSASIGFLLIDPYGNNSSTTMFDVANAIATAVNQGAKVINLSLAGAGESPLLEKTLEQAHNLGVLLVGAAGNDGGTAANLPAANPNVLSVTSTDRSGNLASYANHSSSVDLLARGTAIVNYNGQSYLITGTSTAAANATGAATGLAVNNHQTPLESSAKLATLPGFAPVKKP
jgi:hypothetical protein